MIPTPVAAAPMAEASAAAAAAAAAAEADRRAIFGEDDDDDSDMDEDDDEDDEDDAFDDEATGALHPEDDLNSSASSSDEDVPNSRSTNPNLGVPQQQGSSVPIASVVAASATAAVNGGTRGLQPVPIAPFPPSIHHQQHHHTQGYETPDAKRMRVDGGVTSLTATSASANAAAAVMTGDDRLRSFASIEDSRRLFQRLWTDEDEIIILQGFYDFTSQRGTTHHAHQHDTGPFYEQIRSRLQLDFSKNQLVEKLRRLKKKYRNVVSKMAAGKEFAFKSPHDQATFEISRKIWSGSVLRTGGSGGGSVGGGGYDDEEDAEAAARRGRRRRGRKRSSSSSTASIGLQPFAPSVINSTSLIAAPMASPMSVIPVEIKTVPVEVRSALPALPTTSPAVAVQVQPTITNTTAVSAPVPHPALATITPSPAPYLPPAANAMTSSPAPPPPQPQPHLQPPSSATAIAAVPPNNNISSSNNTGNSMVEETVKSCLSPLFKELLHCAVAGPLTTAIGVGGGGLPINQALMPLGFTSNIPVPKEADADGRWKKQQILELEVFSKRLDLVQEQIKAVLDELRSS